MPNRDPAASEVRGNFAHPGRTDKTAAKRMETVALDTVMTPSRVVARARTKGDTPTESAHYTIIGTRVADENIVISGQLGIDAPEKSRPFGQQARQSLSELAYGRSVSVEWRKTGPISAHRGSIASSRRRPRCAQQCPPGRGSRRAPRSHHPPYLRAYHMWARAWRQGTSRKGTLRYYPTMGSHTAVSHGEGHRAGHPVASCEKKKPVTMASVVERVL